MANTSPEYTTQYVIIDKINEQIRLLDRQRERLEKTGKKSSHEYELIGAKRTGLLLAWAITVAS